MDRKVTIEDTDKARDNDSDKTALGYENGKQTDIPLKTENERAEADGTENSSESHGIEQSAQTNGEKSAQFQFEQNRRQETNSNEIFGNEIDSLAQTAGRQPKAADAFGAETEAEKTDMEKFSHKINVRAENGTENKTYFEKNANGEIITQSSLRRKSKAFEENSDAADAQNETKFHRSQSESPIHEKKVKRSLNPKRADEKPESKKPGNDEAGWLIADTIEAEEKAYADMPKANGTGKRNGSEFSGILDKNGAADTEGESEKAVPYVPDKDSRKLVSCIAYLAGIPKFAIFSPARKYVREIYDMLEESREARIIRNLCSLRTALMKNIESSQTAGADISSDMPKNIVKALCVNRLRSDGIDLGGDYSDYMGLIVKINVLIESNIDACGVFLPKGTIWEYIKEMFVMPEGGSIRGTERAIETYNADAKQYPYQVYINWRPAAGMRGYLLKDDAGFVKKLYAMHEAHLPAPKSAVNAKKTETGTADEKEEAGERTANEEGIAEAKTIMETAVDAGKEAEKKPAEAKTKTAGQKTAETRVVAEAGTAAVKRKPAEAKKPDGKHKTSAEGTVRSEAEGAEHHEAVKTVSVREQAEAKKSAHEPGEAEKGSIEAADAETLQEKTTEAAGKPESPAESFRLLSIIAYLAGADGKEFLGENAKLSAECFNGLETKPTAKNIRELCIVRNSILHEFYNINEALKNGAKALNELSEFIPSEYVLDLIDNGMDLSKPNAVLYRHLYGLNGFIEAAIDGCRELFPEDIEWKYLRSLFIMPRGTAENGSGVTAARRLYRSNIRFTPGNVYINWGNNGRIRNGYFKNDAAFINAFKILYKMDGEAFDEESEEAENFISDSGDDGTETAANELLTTENGLTAAGIETAGAENDKAVKKQVYEEAEEVPVELITLVAYMLGCKMELFLNANNQYDYKQYSELNKVQPATMIRNLCRVRSAIIDRFHSINELMKTGNKRLSDCSHLIPASCVDSLFDIGINIAAPLDSLYEHLYRINGFIEDRIDDCKTLFPKDIKWKYIRNLFIIPKGTEAIGVSAARSAYKESVKSSPDKWSYIHWNDSVDLQGDFFRNDDVFLLQLYRLNGDSFEVLEDEYRAFEKNADQANAHEERLNKGEQRYGGEAHKVVAAAAFLLGAAINDIKSIPPERSRSVFASLKKNKSARILRNLCRLRTAVIRNFAKLSAVMKGDYDAGGNEAELLPADAVTALETDGIRLDVSCNTVEESIITLNRMIEAGFEESKTLFPLWIDYSNVRSIFVMPEGERFSGVRRAVGNYEKYRHSFPGGVYMNRNDDTNILENDRVFVNAVYKGNSGSLVDATRTGSGGAVNDIARLNDFIKNSKRVEFVVDCENANPLKFYSALKSIDVSLNGKIAGITLYDDTNASTIWKSFAKYVDFPIAHETYERICLEKSLVDINLSVGVCRKFYKEEADSFIIVSSDSDYWALINSLVDAKFMMLVEKNNFSDSFKRGLAMAGINFCVMDNFYSGDNDDMIKQELSFQSQRYIVENLALNVHAMIDDACVKARISITPTERRQLLESYMKSMKLQVAPDGGVAIIVSED